MMPTLSYADAAAAGVVTLFSPLLPTLFAMMLLRYFFDYAAATLLLDAIFAFVYDFLSSR